MPECLTGGSVPARPGGFIGAALHGLADLAARAADRFFNGPDLEGVTQLQVSDAIGPPAVRLVSRIKDVPALVRHAGRLSGSVQQSVDNLTAQLAAGNLNPGIGTKHLFGGIFEARARDGARAYFRHGADDTIEILAKSSKGNQNQVIRSLRENYQ